MVGERVAKRVQDDDDTVEDDNDHWVPRLFVVVVVLLLLPLPLPWPWTWWGRHPSRIMMITVIIAVIILLLC